MPKGKFSIWDNQFQSIKTTVTLICMYVSTASLLKTKNQQCIIEHKAKHAKTFVQKAYVCIEYYVRMSIPIIYSS